MKKTVILLAIIALQTTAAAKTHTVVPGDSMWKIATKYEVGLSELKSENPQIKDYTLIYPGQKINIPEIDSSV